MLKQFATLKANHSAKLSQSCLCRFVKRSMHGTRMMSTGEIHEVYGRELVILRNESRWTFLNTLFSVSEAVMYAQVLHHSHSRSNDKLYR